MAKGVVDITTPLLLGVVGGAHVAGGADAAAGVVAADDAADVDKRAINGESPLNASPTICNAQRV